MKPVSTFGRRDGFSLPEAIGGLMLFTIMMAALTYGTATLFKFQAQPQVVFNSQVYSQAPSFRDFQQAINLHAAFANAVDVADNVVVLGGQRSHPTLDPVGPSSILSENFTDTSLTAAAGSDPFQAYSSWDQRQVNAAQFGPYLTASPDQADFTILTLQGLSRITSITQQRRSTSTINGENVVLYEVTHQTIDWSTGSPVLTTSPLTGTTPTYFYRIYYAVNEDTWAQAPGATHFWYRTDSSWDRDQEGPTRVIFADPFVLSGQDPKAQITSVSRFMYFLAQQQ
jgi:hypothetical protein